MPGVPLSQEAGDFSPGIFSLWTLFWEARWLKREKNGKAEDLK